MGRARRSGGSPLRVPAQKLVAGSHLPSRRPSYSFQGHGGLTSPVGDLRTLQLPGLTFCSTMKIRGLPPICRRGRACDTSIPIWLAKTVRTGAAISESRRSQVKPPPDQRDGADGDDPEHDDEDESDSLHRLSTRSRSRTAPARPLFPCQFCSLRCRLWSDQNT
jgi:hypothetical protein